MGKPLAPGATEADCLALQASGQTSDGNHQRQPSDVISIVQPAPLQLK
jgi:hypothetical protein